MTVTYIKSLSIDFNGILNPGQLINDINNNPGISAICIVVTNKLDIVNIIFESSLTSSEQIILS